jgi:hypothetical protein
MIGRIPEECLNIFGEGKLRIYSSRRGVVCSLPSLFLSLIKIIYYLNLINNTAMASILNLVIHDSFEKIKTNSCSLR